MRKIGLTQGKQALVDDNDFDFLSQWKWFAHRKNKGTTYYAVRTCREEGVQRTVRMHNAISDRYVKKNYTELDHRDRNGLNNQKSNLRISTHGENMHNTPNYGNCLKGVRIHKSKYKAIDGKTTIYIKYQARITVKKKTISLGYFETEKEAYKAYKKGSEKHYPNCLQRSI
jgi:hypothetical protein